MTNKDGWNRCNKCGKYVSVEDINMGKGFCNGDIELYIDDYGEIDIREYLIIICSKCYEKDKNQDINKHQI